MTEAGAVAVAVAGAGAAAAAAADARHKEAGAMERSTIWGSSSVAESASVPGAGAAVEAAAGAGADAVAVADAAAVAVADADAAASVAARAATVAATGAGALAVVAAVFSNPVLPPVSPPLTRALAASAGRVSHALRAVLVESLAELACRVAAGTIAQAELEALRAQLGLSARDLREATRVGRALATLPALHAAFRTGRASYTKVRAAVRKATPATDGAWATLVQRVDTAAVEAFAEATPPGALPPATPAGLAPLRPAGDLIREPVYVVLEGPAGPRMASLRATLERLAGRPLDTAEAFAALAGWYLSAHARKRRDAVIYQRSPESRVPGRGHDALSPALATLSSVSERLAAAFPHACAALADPPRARRAWARLAALTAPPQPVPMPWPRPSPEPSQPNSPCRLSTRRHIPTLVRAAVRWRDGEVCVVPGCGNALVVQHDHGTPVAVGGRADIVRDHRLCGPCNRAKHRGELRVWSLPDGTAEVTDRAGTVIGEGPLEGADLDAALFARCWAEGVRDVAAMTLPSVLVRADPAPLAALASAG